MLVQPTLEQLYAMRLNGMAEAFRRQLEDAGASELSFEERFALLVESQWTWKQSRALTRRLALAKLKQPACVEDIDFRHPRGLERARWMSLAHESTWVRRKQNVVLTGPTGVGKSFLACALAQRPAGTASVRCTRARRNCSGTCRRRAPQAGCHDCWASWHGSTP